MVNFTCNTCGETLRKNQVNKHCQTKCKSAWNFTCIDCQKVFSGFEFDAHIACISETEKYQGKFLETKKRKEADAIAKYHWRGWHKETKKIMADKSRVRYSKLFNTLFATYKDSDQYKSETEEEANNAFEQSLCKHNFEISQIKYVKQSL